MNEAAASEAELATILAGYAVPALPGPHGHVVSARVLRVSTAAGDLAIKLFAADERAVAHVEVTVLAHLQAGLDDDCRVQHLVRTRAGEAWLELGERRVLVTRWEHGFHRAYHEIDPPGWAQLGRTLATLHRRLDAARMVLPDALHEIRARDLDRDRELLEEHRRRAASSQAAAAPSVRRLLDDRATLLERHAVRCQRTLPTGDTAPIHNDYNVHNYLFHRQGPPTILDWERAVRAPRELEVARCLSHLPLVAPRCAWAFVDGYLERRALDPRRLAWAFDASLRAHALKHWPVELWLAGAPGAAARVHAMAEIVRAFVAGHAGLEAFIDALRTRAQRGPTA